MKKNIKKLLKGKKMVFELTNWESGNTTKYYYVTVIFDKQEYHDITVIEDYDKNSNSKTYEYVSDVELNEEIKEAIIKKLNEEN